VAKLIAMSARPVLLTAGMAAVLVLSAACRAPQASRITHASGDAQVGRVLVAVYGCAYCHAIPGVVGGASRVGPPLSGMADRGYIGGVLPNTEDSMIEWLMDPPAMATRTAMPNLHVTEAHARDITAFLFTLRAEPVIMRMLRGYLERATGRQSEAARFRPVGQTAGDP
jgi:cytochrome c